MKEICRKTITINGRDFIVRIQKAEANPDKFVPIIDWPNGKDVSIGSCTAKYMGDTPEKALNLAIEALNSIGTLKRL